MNNGKKFIVALVMVAGSLLVEAGTTYYVDCTKADDAGVGTSEATAKKYIQSAVDLCAKSGDTVVVLPGEYKNDPTTLVDGVATRVAIANKCVYLKSRDGKAKTRIIGAWSTDASNNNNCGPGAVRCVAITGADAVNTVVEGFTICKGATELKKQGGGVYGSDIGQKGYVVDCDIVDCCGNGGGGTGASCAFVTAVRCVISRSEADRSGTCAFGAGTYVNCVLMGSVNPYYGFTRSSCLYNCTVLCHGFAACWWGSGSYEIYNTLAVASKGLASGSPDAKVYNSVLSGSGKFGTVQDSVTNVLSTVYQVVSPLSGDYRLTSDSAARNVGRAEWLSEKLDALSAPATVDFYRDLVGNPIPKTGAIHAGAVQAVASVDSSGKKDCIRPTAAAGGVSFDGCPRCLKGDWDANWENEKPWFMSDRYPCQVKLGWDNYDTSLMYYTDSFGYTWLPDRDGTAYVTIPDSNTVYYIAAAKIAAKVYYVDCGRPDDSGDGLSEATAKRTVQAAVTEAKNANVASLVLVKPGTYDEGGIAIGGLMSRVGFSAGSPATCVRSTGGRDVTIVKGAVDPNGDTNGLGDNAVRCVGFGACTNCYVQGFTLTGGRTANGSGASDSMKYGGGVYGVELSMHDRVVADCTVTNNRAWRYGGMYRGTAVRSHFADNRRCDDTTGYSFAYQTSVFRSCLVRVEQGGTYAFDGNCFFFNSTVDWIGAPVGEATHFFNPGSRYANSILCNCRKVQLYNSTSGLFLVGCDLFGTTFLDTYYDGGARVEGYSYVTDSPMFADRRRLDYRPANTRLLTASDDFLTYNSFRMMDRDVEGRPFVFTDGRILPGACQELGEKAGMVLMFR